MRKALHILMAAVLILAAVVVIVATLHTATANGRGASEAPAESPQLIDDSDEHPSAQSGAEDHETTVPVQAPTTERTDSPNSNSLTNALDSYDALYQAIFAEKGGTRDEYMELARRRGVLESLLIPRIDAAMQRKYRVRPALQSYSLVIENVVDMIYTKPCRGCINVNFEMLPPTDVGQGVAGGYLHYNRPDNGLHCAAKIEIAREAANDEAYLEDVGSDDCFEPISDRAERNDAPPGRQ